MASLCLNMIVRNEADRIERALDSVKDYITSFAIFDTGSSDNTPERIKLWAERHKVNGIIAHGVFMDFSQARNQALDLAHSWHGNHSSPDFDYLLLMDADMELRVTAAVNPFENLADESYEMMQSGGSVVYANTRLLSVKSAARYTGVTHEYLCAEQRTELVGADFIDHCDGANRPNKLQRDVDLLTKDLERDAENPRSWFYLANTFFDMGDWANAVRCYTRRVAIGGWDEEVFYARYRLALALKAQGLPDVWVSAAIEAFRFRPRRAEPLHVLAKHYRETSQHAVSLLFSQAGLQMELPDDKLFNEKWMYEWGFREEFSISGFYEEATKERAFKVTNSLALDPSVPVYIRAQARRNIVFSLRPLQDFAPSAVLRMLNTDGIREPGYNAMNPCVCEKPNGSLEVLLRTVNYRINEQGQYMIGEKGCWDAPIDTRNHLLSLDHEYNIREHVPVEWVRPVPKYNQVIGLEDMRIFWYRGERRFVACAREQSDTGTPEQWHGYLRRQFGSPEVAYAEGAERISPPDVCEKNWAPLIVGPDLRYVYRLDTIVTTKGEIEKCTRPIAVENISGGSQYIAWRSGYLSIVHEAISHPTHGRRIYQHRFAYFDWNFTSLKLSLPFVFRDAQIEFAAGIARNWHEKKLVISFGERDQSAWLCSVSDDDVGAMLGVE